MVLQRRSVFVRASGEVGGVHAPMVVPSKGWGMTLVNSSGQVGQWLVSTWASNMLIVCIRVRNIL